MDLLGYFGRFHPVLVHFPIAVLLTAIGFEWLSGRKGFRKIRKSVRWLLLLGFLSAFVSAVTGYLHAGDGEFDAEMVNTHQWLGILVTLVSGVACLLVRSKQKELRLAYVVMLGVLTILIALAGHTGGNI